MSGNETHGFDLAIELSENFFNQFMGVTLDAPGSEGAGILCQLLTGIGLGDLCGIFTVDVLMDRPTDVALPASARNVLDMRIGVGGGSLRFVVGIAVDRSAPDTDSIFIDFEDRLYFAQASFGVIPIPEIVLNPLVSSLFGKLALPSVPISNGRSSSSPRDIIRADTKVIDDTAAADLDAWGLFLTFGGGTPGNLNQFTQGFIPPGGNGGIAFNFSWLLRILDPLIADALGIPRADFTNGTLNRSFRIDDDEDVDLTRLQMTLEDGYIALSAAVSKSGTCYDATGTVGARIRIEIVDGELVVDAQVDDPDIDVDIPWYCWLAGIAIGAVLGFVLAGVIGAIIGAVLVPIITWIAAEVIEGVVEDVANNITGTINDALTAVRVPMPLISFVFDRVFIDDIKIKMLAKVHDGIPLKAQGTINVPNGSFIDFDTGSVSTSEENGADLHFTGSGFGRYLSTVCISSLARTGSRQFDDVARFNLYGYAYQSEAKIPLGELADYDPLGFLWGDSFDERRFCYAVKTNENRFTLFRVVAVESTHLRIQFKTWDTAARSLAISGVFTCEYQLIPPADAVVEFTPISTLLAARKINMTNALTTAECNQVALSDTAVHQKQIITTHAMVNNRVGQQNAQVVQNDALQVQYEDLALTDRRIGRWLGEYELKSNNVGRFTAKASGLRAPVVFKWAINGDGLDGESGTIAVDGNTVDYVVHENRVKLEPKDGKKFTFELKVIAVDDAMNVMTKTRCITYEPICKVTRRHIPTYREYRAQYKKQWGVVEVPLNRLKQLQAASPVTDATIMR